MARRFLISLAIAVALLAVAAGQALACGGLVAPNGAVNLLRTTTLAGYHGGIEHYLTAFTFTGSGGGKFGSLVPLPGIPTKVERGGDWTLQRLLREVQPVFAPEALAFASASLSPGRARVILETRIDALDITVLEGGAAAVAQWATENGFVLSPDAPEVLEFYAARSPIFMAARFDADAAARLGQGAGDGTPIHLTIPTVRPWVPLRILALGKKASEPVEADVFLLTDRAPAMLPAPPGAPQSEGFPTARGLELVRSEAASPSLVADLRSDKGMSWIPESGMWLSYLRVNSPAGELRYDLALDASGAGQPSWEAAGLHLPKSVIPEAATAGTWAAAAAAGAAAALAMRLATRRRPTAARP